MIVLKLEATEISQNAELICIQARKGNDLHLWRRWKYESEELLLKAFLDWFMMEEDKIIIGFNILKFDVPLLLMKCKKFDNFDEFFKKINSANIIDLFVLLTLMNKGNIKGIDFYAQKLIGKNIIGGEEILKQYKEKKYQELEKSIVKNLNTTQDLFMFVWKKFNAGEFIKFEDA